MNVLAPVGYAYWGAVINDSLVKSIPEIEDTWDRARTPFFVFKYLICALQLISGLFMLWAIKRLNSSIKSTPEFGGLLDQRMVVIHTITFAAYLTSVLIYNVIYYLISNTSNRITTTLANVEFLLWTLS